MEQPVSTYLPEFVLYTSDLTAQVTPVDMLSHRTGLPRHDAVWYFNRDFTREDLVRRLRYLEPNKPLREAYQYNNFMFLTAGYLTGRALSTSTTPTSLCFRLSTKKPACWDLSRVSAWRELSVITFWLSLINI